MGGKDEVESGDSLYPSPGRVTVQHEELGGAGMTDTEGQLQGVVVERSLVPPAGSLGRRLGIPLVAAGFREDGCG